MTDYVMPCDSFVRLTNVLTGFPTDTDNQWFNSVRIDNGQAVATNRIVMAIENIGGVSGVTHIKADPVLIDQCRREAQFSSKVTFTVNEALRYTVAKTTLGYVHSENCGLWLDAPNQFDGWRNIVMQCKDPAKKTSGAMFWDVDNIARLAATSPSGRLAFEEFIIAPGRPTLIRDANDPDWLGVFNPYKLGEKYTAATLPGWMTA